MKELRRNIPINEYDIAVIGAGTFTGFFACFYLDALNGAAIKSSAAPRVAVIEKLSRPFKKIAASGNGRCNYSNSSITENDYLQLENDETFRRAALASVRSLDIALYLNGNLIFSRRDEYGRLFPFTNSAKTIVYLLETKLKKAGFETLFDTRCTRVQQRPADGRAAAGDGDYKDNAGETGKDHAGGKNGFIIECENTKTGRTISINSKILILACGGAAYPQLGTDGSAFELIKKMGHSVSGPAPGICALETVKSPLNRLSGIKIEAGVKYKNFRRTGEILFTEYGLSGPNILYLSNPVSKDLYAKEKVVIDIDFLPAAELDAGYFTSKIASKEFYSNSDIFSGVADRSFLNAFFSMSAIDGNARASEESVTRIHAALKSHKIKILRARPFNEAQVSLGGVNCAEINPETLESKLIKNLYFGGEAIDFTGGCGGYNIHFAAVCARAAVKSIFKFKIYPGGLKL
jgi:hypothetical protein